jgi:hypothetical protein
MELERRGRVRRSHARSNWKQEDLDACDRQAVWSACLPDGSRVRRESHARFCERPVVKFRRPTQPHICVKKRSNGRFTVLRQTIRKRLQTKLNEVKAELQRRMHEPIPEMGKWLQAVVRGHIRYYGVPMNRPALALFRFRVGWLWHRALSRRSQNGRVLWNRMRRLITRWLPLPTVCHPYPLRRMGVIT